MEIAALGRSAETPHGEEDAPSLTVVLGHSVSEVELVLREAEEEAASIRRHAHAEAARVRRDAGTHVRERLRRAAATAREVTDGASSAASTMLDDARALHAEAQEHAEEAARRRDEAAAGAERLLEGAEAAAQARHRRAEDEALALLQEAWDVAASLQEELLEEASAEVDSMLARAEADATVLRAGAEELFREAHRLRREADGVRDQARRYADDLAMAALQATPAVVEGPAAQSIATEPTQGRSHRRWIFLVVAVVLAVAALRSFVAEPQMIAGVSMQPTLDQGQRVVVNKLAYLWGGPHRGDVVVVAGSELTGERLVKRVIGLPGETVRIRGGDVSVNGRWIDHWSSSRHRAETASRTPVVEFEVGDDEVFLLGDHRAASRDSRSFGPVPMDDIIGRVDAVFWPLADIGTV